MIYRHYKDFDDLFLNFNKEIILHPDKLMSYTQNIQGFLEDVVIDIDDYKCTLDLSNFGYTKGKWPHLMRSYIDYPQLVEYKKVLPTLTGMSKTYYFQQHFKGNGPCLIAIVLTRPKRKGPWKSIKVFYRTCELQKKLSADLILINRFIKELPQECCEIDSITMHMAQAYVSGMFINGYFEYFNVDRKLIARSKHPWHKTLMGNYTRFFKDPSQLNNYKALQKMQNLHFGLVKLPHLKPSDFSIVGYFESRKK